MFSTDPRNWLSDLYPLLRQLLFQLDAETAHHFAITCLKKGLGPHVRNDSHPLLRTNVCGLDFPNPVGLAAGFDKQCEVIDEILQFGFGFAEAGGVVPLPQVGNPKPRLFRVPEARAVINRMGLNSDGMDACLRRFAAWHDASIRRRHGIVGINIGKNKDGTDAAADYVTGIKKFAPYADYFTLNISSPNTPGLRNLQGREQMAELLKQVMAAREAGAKKPPVFVKIAPDLTEAQQEDIAEVVLESGAEGMVAGNTTVSRRAGISPHLAKETGGLSGKPLFEMSTQLLSRMYKRTQGKIPLIGCGGVFSAEDTYAKIRAGASLVQLYTALIYEGPGLVPRITRGVAALLKRDGFRSVGEAVGCNHR